MLRDTETTETEHHQIALPSPNLASTKEQKKRWRRHVSEAIGVEEDPPGIDAGKHIRRLHDYLPLDRLTASSNAVPRLWYSLNFSILLVCLLA